jgi:hypothetical protein
MVRADRRAAGLGPRPLHGVRPGPGISAWLDAAAHQSDAPLGVGRRLDRRRRLDRAVEDLASRRAAGLALALTVVAFATGNHRVWAAIAMAAVAMLSSLAPAAGPL